MLDHPVVSEINRTGYPNLCDQEEHVGFDVFDDEVLVGDDIVEFNGDIILQDNLERYLSEKMVFIFKTAE